MREYRYDHVHLRSPDPDATAKFFETMFGAAAKRDIYPPGTLYPGQMRVTLTLGGQTVLMRRRIRTTRQRRRRPFRTTGWSTSG
jgi:hypothetical protein